MNTMQFKYIIAALGCASLMVGFAACGGDDDDDTAGSGGGASTDPCEQFCPVVVDLDCPNADTCESTCPALLSQLPAGCETELDAFVACMGDADDPTCGTVIPLDADSCDAESAAVLACVMSASGTGGMGNAGSSGTSGAPASNGGAAGGN
jgi:hypothetical protein